MDRCVISHNKASLRACSFGAAIRTAGAILTFLVLATGCHNAFSEFERFNKEGMHWQEYMDQHGHELDLTGATSISIGGRYTIDSYDLWYKVATSEADYETLWNRRDHELGNRDYVYCQWSGAAVCKTIKKGWIRMENWPSAEIAPASWWDIEHSARLECTAWEFTRNSDRGVALLNGEIWAYDGEKGLLWIWRWGRQHYYRR